MLFSALCPVVEMLCVCVCMIVWLGHWNKVQHYKDVHRATEVPTETHPAVLERAGEEEEFLRRQNYAHSATSLSVSVADTRGPCESSGINVMTSCGDSVDSENVDSCSHQNNSRIQMTLRSARNIQTCPQCISSV